MPPESLRIKKLESVIFYVNDLDRSRKFWVDTLDFAEIGGSNAELTASGRAKSAVFSAGDANFIHITPEGKGGRVDRYLSKHPDGVGTLVFEVEDIGHTFRTLEARGGTPISDIQTFEDDTGKLQVFSITTPFGPSTFRFLQRDGYQPLYPGFEATPGKGGANRFGFERVDHVTSNFQTMGPALLWMEHVMGFEKFWDISFHTNDYSPNGKTGSGLKSIVMSDPYSGAKFANNEPLRPFFKQSQINLFTEDLRDDGIQHIALTVPNIIQAVRDLRERKVAFMPTPGTYYDMLPVHLERTTIGSIDEDPQILRELEILVDGNLPRSYMLQIFLQEAAGMYKDQKAGPFFLEIIQRKGDKGFGGGNFRSLFESIERQQRAAGRIA
jgi:4-hydroxyphenylpyruvate dioxygenase